MDDSDLFVMLTQCFGRNIVLTLANIQRRDFNNVGEVYTFHIYTTQNKMDHNFSQSKVWKKKGRI